MTVRSHVFRRVAAALMISSSLTIAGVALSAQAQAQGDPVSTFLTSQYTYCDAKLIAGLWKSSIEDAKAAIGLKIQNGQEEDLATNLTAARAVVACEWADVPHGYDDAEKLAQAWGLADVTDAKDKIAYLYTQGRSADVLAALGEQPVVDDRWDEEALTAFYGSDYTYCDAKLIGALWNIGSNEAKAEIGRKIVNGYGENLPMFLTEARRIASCDFFDTGLGYDDAERLAGVWGVSVDEAKDKAAAYYTNGESRIVSEALAS